MRRTALLLLLTVVLVGCRDDGPAGIGAPEDLLTAMSDGTVAGGNPDVFFLQPVVASQPTIPAASVFNPNLLPQVDFCTLETNKQGVKRCKRTVKTYTATAGAISVSTTDEEYKLNWNTADVGPGNYRGSVRLGDLVLGFFDITVDSKSTGTIKHSKDAVVVQNGSTVPVKFYVGMNAVPWAIEKQTGTDLPDCSVANDCIVYSVSTSSTQTTNIVTPEELAGVSLHPGWANTPEASNYPVINVIIYQQEAGCLPNSREEFLEQADHCYHFSTFPVLNDGFNGQVRVEVCLDPLKSKEEFDLWKYSLVGPEGEVGLRKLEAVPDQLVDCPEPPVLVGYHPLLRRAAEGLRVLTRPVMQLLGPTPLYAGDTGAGGLAGSFSDIGWASTADSHAHAEPVSHWSMEAVLTSGDTSSVPDVAGTNNGTLSGTYQRSTVTGVSGNAVRFFGPNYPGSMLASGTGIDGAAAITLAGWVSLDSGNAGGGIQRFVTLGNEKAVIRLDALYEPNGTTNSLHFYVHTASLTTDGPVGRGVYAPGALTERGCFYHVVGTYDGATLRLYLNGVNVASLSHTGTLVAGNGVLLSNPGEMLHGALDEVKVYSQALTATEVQSLFAHRPTAANVCPGPVILR